MDDQRYKEMIEGSQDWFWEFDEKANFTYSSPRIRDMLGYDPEEVIGLNAFDLMDEDEARRVRAFFDPIAEKFLPFNNLINVNTHKDGRKVVIESSGTPIFDSAGLFCGYRGIDRDITDRYQAETALLQSEATFKKLFHDSPDPVFLLDSTGVFVECNQAALDLLKMTREQLFEIPPAEVSPEFQPDGRRSAEAAPEMVAQAYKKGRHRFDWTHINAEGGEFMVEVSLMPLVIKGQSMLHVTWRDITERKRMETALQQSEETFKKLFSESSDAILLIDNTGVFVECNQAALDLLKMTREQFLQLPPASISPEFQPDGRRSSESAPEMIALAYSKGLHRFDWTCVNAEGGEFIVEVSLMPLVIKGQTMLHTTWRNITERKKAEAQLKESNKELDAFVNTIAHDLRTPITPILGYAEILRETYKDVLGEKGLSYLAEVEKSAEEMLALMEDLLTLAKSGEVQLLRNGVSTDKVVAGVIKNLEAEISKTGIVIQKNPLPPVRLPETFLSQIFGNLIGNALRYADKSRGPIEIGGERYREKVRFFVRDHGPGIPEHEFKHIFEIFYRGTNTREVKGTGIGLAIVNKLARNCGGRAWVEETPGGGCTFWVEIDY